MHAQLAEKLVASVRTRIAQGDCPTEPALSVENLEDMVITLADRIVAADTKGLTYDEAKALGRDDGVDFVFDHLAKALGLKQWSVHDGSETWDGDVLATLMGILRDSGAIDPETDTPAAEALAPASSQALREALKAEGWSVAVHNDYRLNGEDWTFWLFTHPDGRWIKGEGINDEVALLAARSALSHALPGETK